MTALPHPRGARFWAGWILSGLVAAFLFFSCSVKLIRHPVAVDATTKLGYPEYVVFPFGVLECLGTVLFLIPQTAPLGAILLTGYLGGATATHVRTETPFVLPLVLGVFAWVGLLLRDRRFLGLILFSTGGDR